MWLCWEPATPYFGFAQHRPYQEFARHYGLAVVPAHVRKPKDKAKVEVGVQVVERWILARLPDRTFFSLAELNQAIGTLLSQLNQRQMKHLGQSRQELFVQLEQPVVARAIGIRSYKGIHNILKHKLDQLEPDPPADKPLPTSFPCKLRWKTPTSRLDVGSSAPRFCNWPKVSGSATI